MTLLFTISYLAAFMDNI